MSASGGFFFTESVCPHSSSRAFCSTISMSDGNGDSSLNAGLEHSSQICSKNGLRAAAAALPTSEHDLAAEGKALFPVFLPVQPPDPCSHRISLGVFSPLSFFFFPLPGYIKKAIFIRVYSPCKHLGECAQALLCAHRSGRGFKVNYSCKI